MTGRQPTVGRIRSCIRLPWTGTLGRSRSMPPATTKSCGSPSDECAIRTPKRHGPLREVVQRGPVFDFADRDATLRYVRAEVIRHSEEGPIRLFINPFALTHP